MADGTNLNPAHPEYNTGLEDTLAADEIGGKKHIRAKMQYGADGSATDTWLEKI